MIMMMKMIMTGGKRWNLPSNRKEFIQQMKGLSCNDRGRIIRRNLKLLKVPTDWANGGRDVHYECNDLCVYSSP